MTEEVVPKRLEQPLVWFGDFLGEDQGRLQQKRQGCGRARLTVYSTSCIPIRKPLWRDFLNQHHHKKIELYGTYHEGFKKGETPTYSTLQ
jgi:hypothetical protein